MKISVLIGLLLFLSGCKSKQPDLNFPKIYLEGYRTYPTATTDGEPGSIYRVRNKNYAPDIFRTLELEGKMKTRQIDFLPKSYKLTKYDLIGLFGLGNFFNFKRDVSSMMEVYLGNATKEYVEVEDLNKILSKNRFKPNDDFRYYVIAETILVDTISIKFINSRELRIDDSLNLREIASKGFVKQYRSDTLFISHRFPTRMRILYKPLPINKKGMALDDEYAFEVGEADSLFFISSPK